jgi:hypothetical protein
MAHQVVRLGVALAQVWRGALHEPTDRVMPPTPLGRMGQRLAEIAAMEPEKRPLDLYAACAEVAR